MDVDLAKSCQFRRQIERLPSGLLCFGGSDPVLRLLRRWRRRVSCAPCGVYLWRSRHLSSGVPRHRLRSAQKAQKHFWIQTSACWWPVERAQQYAKVRWVPRVLLNRTSSSIFPLRPGAAQKKKEKKCRSVTHSRTKPPKCVRTTS